MTSEEQLINRYFDAFNRHDLEEVVACFHEEAVLVAPNGKKVVGIAEVRRSYETDSRSFLMRIVNYAYLAAIVVVVWRSLISREPNRTGPGSRRSVRK